MRMGLGLGLGSGQAGVMEGAPEAPIALDATSITDTSFTANWSDVSGETGYKLDIATADTFGAAIIHTYVLGSDVVSQIVDAAHSCTLTAGLSYYYRVRAYNDAGDGANSNTITVALWTPANIQNVNAWFDALSAGTMSHAYADTTKVSAWVDRIGGTKTYTAADATAPRFDSDSNSIRFTAANSTYMKRSHSMSGQTNISYVFILKIASWTGASQYISAFNTGGNDVQMYVTDTGALYLYGGTSLVQATSKTKFTANFKMLIYNYIKRVTSEDSIIKAYHLNAADDTVLTKTGNAGSNSIPVGDIMLGRNYYNNAPCDCYLKGVISVYGTITDSDLTLLSSFVTNYYGVQ